jgi:CRP-like cAMP-binding protein
MTEKTKKRRGDVLRKVTILSDLTDDELKRLSSIAKKLEIPAGDVIIREGEIGSSMYFFVEGAVNVTKNLTLKLGKAGFSNVEKSMVKLRSDTVSFFGDMAMFEDEPRSATITASTDCLLYEVDREDFESMGAEHPELGLKILRRIATALCQRIRRGNQDVLKLSTALSIALSKQ